MIKRINLVEKKAFTFTYQKLLQVCLVVVAFNALLVGYQVFKVTGLRSDLEVVQAEFQALEKKNQELLKKPQKKKISIGQYQELFDRIDNTPRWSRLLSEMAASLPNTVWITAFRSSTGSTQSKVVQNKAKGKNKKEKEAQPVVSADKKHRLELNGLGFDIKNITEFAKNLSQSEYFKELTIADSHKETFGVSFKITSEIESVR